MFMENIVLKKFSAEKFKKKNKNQTQNTWIDHKCSEATDEIILQVFFTISKTV